MRVGRSYGVTCLVALALLGAACTSPAAVSTTTSSPVTTIASTAWVPVAYGDAQLSVPANWYVLYGQPPCPVGQPPGELFVNPAPGVYHCPAETGHGAFSVVDLEALARTENAGRKVFTINGITVREATAPTNTYLVRSLGAQVTVDGPLGLGVLHTLARAPRVSVLATAGPARVPSSWHRIAFAGVSIAAPSSWSVMRANSYGPDCSALQQVEFGLPSVVLDTDERIIFPPCPYLPPYQRPQTAGEGLRIDKLTIYPPVARTEFRNCLRINGLSTCPAASPGYSILVLRVEGPTLSKPVYISIGLGGNGGIARTILHSLRAS